MGDVEAGFAESDKVVEFKWSEEEETPAGVEALSAIAVFKGDYLELWVHNQDPLRTQPEMVKYWGPYHKISIHSLYQGAQFGFANWLSYYKQFPIVAAILAEKTNKPVKYLYDGSYWQHRSYEQGVHYFKIGFNNDGTIVACQDDAYVPVTEFNAKMMHGTKIKNYQGTSYVPYFNRPACVCFRHGMRSCGMWNMIYARVAAETGIDPTEVALINDGCHGEPMEYIDEHVKGPQGFPMVNSLETVVALGKEKFGWDEKFHGPGERILPNGKYHGVGFVSSVAWSPDPNTYLSQFQIAIKVQRSDGGIRIIGRHADGGWTHETTICQVVADELGAAYDDIEFRPFDETGIDTGPGCGSCGLVVTLPMTVTCARKVKQQMLEMCCTPGSNGCEPLFPGCTPDDLDTIESTVFEKANPENVKTFAEVSNYEWSYYQPFQAFHSSQRHLWDVSYLGRQATFVEIEVDPETGLIEMYNIVNVNDVGKAINPESVNGQQYGGTTMGLSHNRNEACVYDPATGVKLNDNLIDYKWFSFNDIEGPFSCNILENGLGYAPYGATGCSESLAAVNSTTLCYAFYNATGKWITEFPATPDKVLKALGKI
jgi:xanthine dehydrogenase molybdenum-binding subunit